MTATAAAIWHDVECGGYEADLPLWEELAERQGGPVLDLGCGTGRVSLHLARRGHRVIGLDRDPALIASLSRRASDIRPAGAGSSSAASTDLVQTFVADAREFELPAPVALALAPMQLLQLLPSARDRALCLERLAVALEPGGLLAAAIVESLPRVAEPLPPLPDVREIDGWVYSSLPTAVSPETERIVLRRLRQTVSPAGELSEEDDEIHLRTLSATALEEQARPYGFAPAGRRRIPETEAHVGSTVVLLERAS